MVAERERGHARAPGGRASRWPRRRRAIPIEAPFTGETLGEVPAGTPADVARGRRRGARRPARLGERARSTSAPPCCCAFTTCSSRTPARSSTSSSSRPASRATTPSKRSKDIAIQARYYAHSAADHLRPRRRQGALPLLTPHDRAAPPARRDRHHLALELPAVAHRRRRHPGAARRQRCRAQARRPDALHRPVGGGAARRGRPAGRPAADRHRPRLRARHAADRRHRLPHVHGLQATGKIVAAQAAAQLKDCSMELGGKNPLLVLPDAGLGAAVRGAVRGICANGGQLCISIERLYVHTDLYDAFVPRLAEALRARARSGAGLDFSADMGSLASADQLAKVARPRRRRRGQGRRGAGRRPAAPRPRPLLLRADAARRRDRGHGAVPRGDLRPGRRRLPLRLGRRDGARAPTTRPTA